MKKILIRQPRLDSPVEIDEGQLPDILSDPASLIWVDISGETDAATETLLQEKFGFHSLAVEDALAETHIPKLDDWGTYLYIVLHGAALAGSPGKVELRELDIFIGSNYVVTYQAEPVAAVEHIWGSVKRDDRGMTRGPGYLLYRIADELANNHLAVVDEVEIRVDDIEDRVFVHAEPHLLEDIFALKHAVVHLRRIVDPQQDVLQKLARGDYQVIASDQQIYFRDVYDHFARASDIVDGLRELIVAVLDMYLSIVNNRMNEVMKIFTVITSLFMPLAFLTGFFGMNFFEPSFQLPAWTSLPAFIIALIAMILIPAGMWTWVQRHDWM